MRLKLVDPEITLYLYLADRENEITCFVGLKPVFVDD